MAKSDLGNIMRQLEAKSKAPKPIQIALALSQTNAKPLPWADVLPPKTEWELAQELGLPPAKVNGKGRDLRKPYVWKGEVGQPQKLSELSTEQLDLAGQAEGDARMEDEQPYKGTPQERIAISHIKAKIVRKKPLTNAEKKLWGKFTMAKLVARAGLNRRQA